MSTRVAYLEHLLRNLVLHLHLYNGCIFIMHLQHLILLLVSAHHYEVNHLFFDVNRLWLTLAVWLAPHPHPLLVMVQLKELLLDPLLNHSCYFLSLLLSIRFNFLFTISCFHLDSRTLKVRWRELFLRNVFIVFILVSC